MSASLRKRPRRLSAQQALQIIIAESNADTSDSDTESDSENEEHEADELPLPDEPLSDLSGEEDDVEVEDKDDASDESGSDSDTYTKTTILMMGIRHKVKFTSQNRDIFGIRNHLHQDVLVFIT